MELPKFVEAVSLTPELLSVTQRTDAVAKGLDLIKKRVCESSSASLTHVSHCFTADGAVCGGRHLCSIDATGKVAVASPR